RFKFAVEETGHFQIFLPRRIGPFTLAAGTYRLALKPQRKQASAIMDIRQVKLLPVDSSLPPAPQFPGRRSLWFGFERFDFAVDGKPVLVVAPEHDAPVCDFKSWPGGFGKGKRSDHDWELVLERYGFKSDAEAKAYDKNPVDNLTPLAQAKIPLLHVYGDADEVVPWQENTGLIAER